MKREIGGGLICAEDLALPARRASKLTYYVQVFTRSIHLFINFRIYNRRPCYNYRKREEKLSKSLKSKIYPFLKIMLFNVSLII